MTLLEHKGYLGSANYSPEDEVFHGRVQLLRDLVTYESDDPDGLKAAFEDAVDDYLAQCAKQGRQPDVSLRDSSRAVE